jgi:peptidoglycan/LPS O-acetylase OafA/YrhL
MSVTDAERGQAPPAAALVSGYRPYLDGLRAVAVLLVVAQHVLGANAFELGGVGVGLFFALSGYLITSLLLDERALSGSVQLSRFYLRRAARLVPALLLVLVVCDLLFLIQGDYGPIRGSLFAATYTANYAQVWKEDLVPGFGPTWTLAVEEHFYILWPLALLWLTRRHGLQTALKATLGVCVIALAWRFALAEQGAQIVLGIGSFERADALLYGCAAAIAVRLGWRPRTWMFWVGAAAVAYLMRPFLGVPYSGSVVGSAQLAIGAAAVVVCLDYASPGWVRQLLSGRALVTVGVISYGLYLWHGPLMRVALNWGITGRAWRLLVALVALVLAAASYRYLERPVRAWARRRSDGPPPTPEPAGIPARA